MQWSVRPSAIFKSESLILLVADLDVLDHGSVLLGSALDEAPDGCDSVYATVNYRKTNRTLDPLPDNAIDGTCQNFESQYTWG